MSYCRWSCDNFKSDVYVYESEEGFVIHVAGNKIMGDVPDGGDILGDFNTYKKAYAEQSAFMEMAERVPIGLSHDGEMFTEPSPADCLRRLMKLRYEGYYVPDHAISQLREEEDELC